MRGVIDAIEVTNDHNDLTKAPIHQYVSELCQRPSARVLKGWPQRQIFHRIASHHHLWEDNHMCAIGMCRGRMTQDEVKIAGKIPNTRVYLRKGKT